MLHLVLPLRPTLLPHRTLLLHSMRLRRAREVGKLTLRVVANMAVEVGDTPVVEVGNTTNRKG
jgi:hypothetical protein